MNQNRNAPYSFTQEQVDEVLKVQHRAYIYGAGESLEETIGYLREQGVTICGILDRDPVLWGRTRKGVAIYPPEHLEDTNIPVIICARLKYDDIYDYLTSRGCTCILPFYFYKPDQVASSEEYRAALAARHREIRQQIERLKKPDPLLMDSLDVVLTERCSLRCKDCSNLMQFYEAPRHEDISVQLKALDTVMEAVDMMNELRVLGGEPFVSPDFAKYVRHMLKYNNLGTIVIYTNATVLPKGDALECLKDPRIFVRPSDYGLTQQKLPQLEQLFRENHILYETILCRRWQDCSGFHLRERTEDELKGIYAECCVTTLYTLKDGKIYGCPFIANAAALHAIPADACRSIATDKGAETLRQDLRELMSSNYFEGCRYCTGRPPDMNIPAAIQTAAPLPYSRLD